MNDQSSPDRARLPRIGLRLFAAGAILVLVTGLVVAVVGATIARQAVLAEAERRVLALAEQREAHLQDWLGAYFDTAERLARTVHPHVTQTDTNSLHEVLLSLPGLLDARVLNLELSDDQPSRAELSRWQPDLTAVNAARLSRQIAYGPLHLDVSGVPVFDVVLPVALSSTADSALLALHLDSREVLNPILTDTSGLGSSGELFLLDREMRMLTPSRFHRHPEPLMHRMDIPPARAALDSVRGSMEYTSFLGEPVVGGYVYMPRQRLILVGELGVEEALAPVTVIYQRTALILGAALLLVLIATLFLARSWARPIVRLTRASERVAEGDYEVHVAPPGQQDELHTLTTSFNRMTVALLRGREDLARAQRRLVQQETVAAIGRLVSSIVHEMRNPLSSIKMNLRLLERAGAGGEHASEHFQLANSAATRLETMLGELLDHAKPVEPALSLTDVNNIVEQTVAAWQVASSDASIELRLLPDTPSPTVLTDPELLRRCLENLLRNAAEAMNNSGTITVETHTHSGSGVRIAVSDTGKGMSAAVRERVFDPFFTTRDDGTGLGMANVKRFVELLDGTIAIDSQEGEGTTVTITLPGGTA